MQRAVSEREQRLIAPQAALESDAIAGVAVWQLHDVKVDPHHWPEKKRPGGFNNKVRAMPDAIFASLRIEEAWLFVVVWCLCNVLESEIMKREPSSNFTSYSRECSMHGAGRSLQPRAWRSSSNGTGGKQSELLQRRRVGRRRVGRRRAGGRDRVNAYPRA